MEGKTNTVEFRAYGLNKIFYCLLVFGVLLIFTINVDASCTTVALTTDKENYTIGEQINITAMSIDGNSSFSFRGFWNIEIYKYENNLWIPIPFTMYPSVCYVKECSCYNNNCNVSSVCDDYVSYGCVNTTTARFVWNQGIWIKESTLCGNIDMQIFSDPGRYKAVFNYGDPYNCSACPNTAEKEFTISNPSQNCECSSCDECETKLSSNLCNVVKLTRNITNYEGTCIDHPANFNHKTFDCQGHTIDGTGTGYGIDLFSKTNDTIKNCVITSFSGGVLALSFNSTMINNTVNSNAGSGIILGGKFNNVTGNTVNSNLDGIYLLGHFNEIASNTINNNGQGGIMIGGSENKLINNTLNNNNYGIYTIDTNMCWYTGIYNGIFGLCYTSERANNTIQGNEILNNDIGIQLFNSTSIINSNIVCENTNSDFNSSDWLSSSGNNNTCDNPDGWSDDNKTGCTNSCSGNVNCITVVVTTDKENYSVGEPVKITAVSVDGNSLFSFRDIRFPRGMYEYVNASAPWEIYRYENSSWNPIDPTIYPLGDCYLEGCYCSNNICYITNNCVDYVTPPMCINATTTGVVWNQTVWVEEPSMCGDMTLPAPSSSGKYKVVFNYHGAPNCSMCAKIAEKEFIIGTPSQTCECSSCDECEEKLSSNLCKVIKLTQDIINHPGTCINSPANFNHKTFDCQGHTIDGDENGDGIYLFSKTNNTIKNCVITDFSTGILALSFNTSIINNTLSSNGESGITLGGRFNNMTNNTLNSNSDGIYLIGYFNYIANNNINDNDQGGIMLGGSDNNVIHNAIINNSYGIYTANSNFCFYEERIGLWIGLCYTSEKANNIIKENEILNNDIGIYLEHDSINNTLQKNNISNNGIGIQSQNSNSTINSNIVCENSKLDFNSSDWQSSSGDNNTCDNADGWNDGNETGCTNTCSGQPINCTCNSCSDCNNKLNNSACPVVTLMQDIINHSGTCIDDPENFNNKVFDCQGHTIDGNYSGKPGSWDIGISLLNKTNNTIKNCVITKFYEGISALSFNTNFINNNLNLNWEGISLVGDDNDIINNALNSNNHTGILLAGNSNNIESNTVNDNNNGLVLGGSNNNITKNTAFNNSYGIYLTLVSICWKNDIGVSCWTTENINNTLEENNVSNNGIGIGSYNSTSIINSNLVCDNTGMDFNYSGWLSSSGNNNTCDNADGWNDTGETGCANSCSGNADCTTVVVTTDKENYLVGEPVNITAVSMDGNSSFSFFGGTCSFDGRYTWNIYKYENGSWKYVYNFCPMIFGCRPVCRCDENNNCSWLDRCSDPGPNMCVDTTTTGITWDQMMGGTEPAMCGNMTYNKHVMVFSDTGKYKFIFNYHGAPGCSMCANTAEKEFIISDASQICECNSCSDCEANLNNNSCTVVKLTADIINHPGTCINDPENFNNKVFDCQGHTIRGNGSSGGIYLINKTNITIKNCVITNSGGINLLGDYNTLINNTLNSNGMSLTGDYNNIKNNMVNSNDHYGILLAGNFNTLSNNTANDNNESGIIFGGSNNKIIGNIFINNSLGIYFAIHDIYWFLPGVKEPLHYKLKRENNTIQENEILNNDVGIYLFNSNFNKILDNNILNNALTGIELSDCTPENIGRGCPGGNINNTLDGNNISNNGVGIQSYNSTSTINSNYVCENTNLDFNSSKWLSSYGDNNTCDKPDGWADIGTTGCTSSCPVSNIPPTASFTYAPSEPTDLDTVQFTDASTDSDGSIVSWFWDFGDGTNSTEQNSTHQYADNGTYTVTLTVTDDDDAEDTTIQKILVLNVPPEASFNYTPSEPTDIDTVQFTDASTDSDGIIMSWSWDFGDGTNSTDQNPEHQYADNGTYTVTLTVTDDDGAADTTAQEILVLNVPPVADAGADQIIILRETVAFNGSNSSDPDGTIVSYKWNFGDDANAVGVVAVHNYTRNGTYNVTLTVMDDNGAADTDTLIVTVQTPAEAVRDLISDIKYLNLPKVIENSLISKLENTIKLLGKGNEKAAVNQLIFFIDQVNAQRGKSIANEQADELIEAAQWIINNI